MTNGENGASGRRDRPHLHRDLELPLDPEDAAHAVGLQEAGVDALARALELAADVELREAGGRVDELRVEEGGLARGRVPGDAAARAVLLLRTAHGFVGGDEAARLLLRLAEDE